MTSPSATVSSDIDGIWLHPYLPGSTTIAAGAKAWLGGATPSGTAVRSVSVFTIPTRSEKVSQSGALHLYEGSISAVLLTRHGLNADQWLERLKNLIENQHKYDVYMVTSRLTMKVELGDITRESRILGGPGWAVETSYRQLA